MYRLLCALMIAFVCCGSSCSAYAGWGPAGCPPVGGIVLAQTPAVYQWKTRSDTPNETYLYYGTQQVGGYSFETGFYRPIVNGKWGKPAVAPITPPLTGTTSTTDSPLFGVDTSKLTGKEWYSNSGAISTSSDAHRLIETSLKDDSKAGQVSAFVRDPALRQRVRTDAEKAAEAQGSANAAKVQVYDPDAKPNKEILAPFKLDSDERFRQTGFKLVAQAAPTTPDGTSKAESWYEYDGAKQIVEAVRRVDPSYNPNVNPIPSLPSLPAVNWEIIALCILGGLVFIGYTRS